MLVKRQRIRIPINCRRGSQDNPPDSGFARRFEQDFRPALVDVETGQRIAHRLRHGDKSGSVENDVHALDGFGHFGCVAQVAFQYFNIQTGNIFTFPAGEIIQHAHKCALLPRNCIGTLPRNCIGTSKQGADKMRADETGAARYQIFFH